MSIYWGYKRKQGFFMALASGYLFLEKNLETTFLPWASAQVPAFVQGATLGTLWGAVKAGVNDADQDDRNREFSLVRTVFSRALLFGMISVAGQECLLRPIQRHFSDSAQSSDYLKISMTLSPILYKLSFCLSRSS